MPKQNIDAINLKLAEYAIKRKRLEERLLQSYINMLLVLTWW
jgi:hypothetical protein